MLIAESDVIVRHQLMREEGSVDCVGNSVNLAVSYLIMVWEFKSEAIGSLRENYGVDVFNDAKMREYLSASAYKRMTHLFKRMEHQIIDNTLANEIANGMKTWATERGATHFCHWFQPLTGGTAEKHDSFIGKYDPLGRPLLEFDGDTLLRGEPDASSFPSGGLRSTDQARGYTVWDPMSPAFLRHYTTGSVLCIPTAFTSWTGEALDNKTPLLKSEEVMSKECVKMLHFLGETKINRVTSTLGCEQEFFIVRKEDFNRRPDLVMTGRTLVGQAPPKGQDLEDHYFGNMRREIVDYLQDVESQLWRLGVPMKTRHNEVAPGQHELAPVFEYTSLACDHQMLTMSVLQEKAKEHGMVCLLHEKPFAGINGSGKHHNWSMSTDTGKNLLNPTNELLADPGQAFVGKDNTMFTVFLAAVIKAVDDFAGQLRVSIASHGQDFRLGANEAPPAIMSMYLGSSLFNLVENVISIDALSDLQNSPKVIKKRTMDYSVNYARLPTLLRDRTDRNRTSPFAFTGNKFEFRAAGSTVNPSVPCTALNGAVALALRAMNEDVEGLIQKGENPESAVRWVAAETMKRHYRIIFDGDNYSAAWVAEAEKRGLLNYRSTAEALTKVDGRSLYAAAGILSTKEVESRINVSLEGFIKAKLIEAKCLSYMVNKYIVPSALKAVTRLSEALKALSSAGLSTEAVQGRLSKMNVALSELSALTDKIDEFIAKEELDSLNEEAMLIEEELKPLMEEIRTRADLIESMSAAEDYPLPSYADMLFQ